MIAFSRPSGPKPASAGQETRLRRLAGRRWTLDGAVLIRAEETRSQARNREIARERLAELIARRWSPAQAHRHPPDPLGSKRRRLAAKTNAAGEIHARTRPRWRGWRMIVEFRNKLGRIIGRRPAEMQVAALYP